MPFSFLTGKWNVRIFRFLAVIFFFVSPLIFFTDFTRNPYYFQITVLNVSVLIAVIAAACHFLSGKDVFIPRNHLNVPFLLLILFLSFTSVYSYFNHAPFFRPSLFSEVFKRHLFLWTNIFFVYWFAQGVPFSRKRVSAGKWLYFVVIWPILWLFYPALKTPAGISLFSHFFDPYGAFLWIGGAVWVYFMLREITHEEILHLILSAAAIASIYGIAQYFRFEIIWSKLLNPYGNRSVTTFGNPNFVSSYLVMLMPAALLLLAGSRGIAERIFYGFVFLSFEGMLLASLTRSSWIGAAVAVSSLFLFRETRKVIISDGRFMSVFAALALLLLLAWPNDNLKPMSSAILKRVEEGRSRVSGLGKLTLKVDRENIYPSLHQRMLIWTSAWQMGAENPMTGKGWGAFELFYPFYQGPLLEHYPNLRSLRTHANNAHNEILELFSQSGLLGLGIYMWLFAAFFYSLFLFAKRNPGVAAHLLAFGCGMAGMFADNMLNVSLHFAVPAFLFWWLFGAVSSQTARSPEKGFRLDSRLAGPLLWFLIVVSLSGIYFWRNQLMREAWYFRGFKAMRKFKFEDARGYLEKAHAFHSREVNANYELANAYVRLKEFKKAEWAYHEALKSNCGYDEIYFNLAIVEKKLKKYGDALKTLKVSTLINPVNNLNFKAVSEIYMLLGKSFFGEAAEFLERGALLFPEDPDIFNALGYFHSMSGRNRLAKNYYARAVKLNPDDNMLVRNLRMSAARLGIREDPDLLWIKRYRDLSRAASEGRTDSSSIDECDALLAESGNSPAVLYLRSRIYFLLGEYEKAEKDLRRILSFSPNNSNALYALGVILEKKGDCEGAGKKFRRLLKLAPGNGKVKERLADLDMNCRKR